MITLYLAARGVVKWGKRMAPVAGRIAVKPVLCYYVKYYESENQ